MITQWGPITSNSMFIKSVAKVGDKTFEIFHVEEWQIPEMMSTVSITSTVCHYFSVDRYK